MQNRLVILALLGLASVNAAQSVQVNSKDMKKPQEQPKAPQKMAQQTTSSKQKGLPGLTAPGADGPEKSSVWGLVNSSAAIHQDIRSMARSMDIEAPNMEAIKKNMYVPPAEELEKETASIHKLMKEVRVIGGDSGKKNKAATMKDADAACYSSRYSDLKDKPAKEHFKLVGDEQGRLDTCARDLTEYEALTYLHTFPELQQKFGDGPSAIKQARKHYRDIGYAQNHFSEPMKDTTKTAWKCGEGAKQSCKCHGTLWYGATTAPDDKKPIDTWEKMREWKTYTKESEEWMSCTDSNFGGDPWPDQEKQCWCEDKPAYKPWKCADEGDECLCDGGWVVYGAKVGSDKKDLDFFGTIKLSLAITGTRGKKSISCEGGTFDGADPAPDADKACFCDATKKFFDKSFVRATRTFWKSSQLEKQSEGELKRTAEHSTEVIKVTKEKEESAKESTTATGVENEKAISDIQSAKTCAIQSIEESYKFRRTKITQRRMVITKTITKRRTLVTTWQFQLNVKKTSAEASCAQANRKGVQDHARLESECKRMTDESNELTTQIQVENEKISQEEKEGLSEVSKEETELESKRTKDTITVEEKADEDVNEINESSTEKKLDLAEEKEQLLQQQQELVRIQQKTSRNIEVSIKEQQNAINILIKNLRKKLTKMARREQIMVSELSDDAPERETVTNRIISRSKETITKLTTVETTLKEKKTKTTDEMASQRTEIKSLTEKLTGIQAKIVTDQESLKLKKAERKSKREILRSYGSSKGKQTPSAESAIITQAAIDKITKEIKDLRKKLKKNIQQKNEFFSTKVTTQKQIDLYISQVKTIEIQMRNIKEFITEVESTITIVETKIKEEISTKKVIETQKEAFKAAQKKTDAEEELNSTRVVTEKEKDEATAQSKECKKKFDSETSITKQLGDQLKTVKKTAGDAKGKEEKARLDSEVEGLQKQVDDAQKDLDESTKECADIDADLAKVVEESAGKIKKLTKAIEDAKDASDAAEKEAKATIVTLPGGDKDKEEEKKEEKEEKTTITTTSITITTSSTSKTSTGKPKAPQVPAPKPKEEEKKDDKKDDKPKPVPQPVAVTDISPKKKQFEGDSDDDDDEDDGEPAEQTPTEVPGGEAQITKEVTDNTLAAHNARVELVKTKSTMRYELKTIKTTVKKYKENLDKMKKDLEKDEGELKSEQAKLESMKTSAITAKLKDTNKAKLEVEISTQVTKITDMETKITKMSATIIQWKTKITTLIERRKQIKYTIEIKVLEAKEAEAAVMEAIKTVTDVELLNRKRWIASKSVGDYKKCNKFMAEYKMIFEKQGQVIAAELADHTRRIDVAEGAITSLKEKKTQLEDAKKTKDQENQIAKIESELERHEKTVKVEKKVIDAVKEKKEKNTKEFEEHTEKCTKARAKANIATAGVNDAATTLKNQREYQVQIVNLKNVLIASHEQALGKRQEAEKVFQNYTMMVTKYEQQTTITQEQIMDAKTRISGAQEIQRIIAVRMKEITTLLARTTITSSEKTKLQKEEEEIKVKLETQQNTIDTETKNLVTYETSLTTLSTTIKTFKNYITEIKVVVKDLEKKVGETKKALKAPNKKDDAPPVKGKDTEDEDAEEKDDDGDDKIDDIDDKDSEKDAVKGGNEKVDKELDQAEEENKSATTQIDSLTKTITTIEEKSEAADKEVIQEVTDTTKEEAEITETKEMKKRLVRRRERQRCARLFPSVFSSFKIKQELTAENMCPCPNSGKGLTVLYLNHISDPGEYDKFVLSLFEHNLAIEGSFEAEMQKYHYGADDKLVVGEEENISLKLVVNDDKIDEVMQALDAQNLTAKSTDMMISPLLKGKSEYLKWQQTALTQSNKSNQVHLGGELEDDFEEEEEEWE